MTKAKEIIDLIKKDSNQEPWKAYPLQAELYLPMILAQAGDTAMSSGNYLNLMSMIAINQNGLHIDFTLDNIKSLIFKKDIILDPTTLTTFLKKYSDNKIIKFDRLTQTFSLNNDYTTWINKMDISKTPNYSVTFPVLFLFSKNIDEVIKTETRANAFILYSLAYAHDNTNLTINDISLDTLHKVLFIPNEVKKYSTAKNHAYILNQLTVLKDMNVIKNFSFTQNLKEYLYTFSFQKDQTKYFIPEKHNIGKFLQSKKTYIDEIGKETNTSVITAQSKKEDLKKQADQLYKNYNYITAKTAILRKKKDGIVSWAGLDMMKTTLMINEVITILNDLFVNSLIFSDSKMAKIYLSSLDDRFSIDPYDFIDSLEELSRRYKNQYDRLMKTIVEIENGNTNAIMMDDLSIEEILTQKEIDLIENSTKAKKRKPQDINSLLVRKTASKIKISRRNWYEGLLRRINPYYTSTDLKNKVAKYEKEHKDWFDF